MPFCGGNLVAGLKVATTAKYQRGVFQVLAKCFIFKHAPRLLPLAIRKSRATRIPMKSVCNLTTGLFFLLLPLLLPAQQAKPTCEILTLDQVSVIVTPSLKKQFAINFPITRIYRYVDRSGSYYCILTEKFDSLGEDDDSKPDTLHFAIRAINLKEDSGKLTKVWEINDHAVRDSKIEGIEQSIWFWTKYLEFTDLDGDGLIEPIVVYGSRTDSDLMQGRIKFIIYYKGLKVAIRHVDSDLDGGRNTQIDRAYYMLPAKVKECIKNKMLAMNETGHGIFKLK